MKHFSAQQLPVIIIMGPTASGKTQFSFDLADSLQTPCEMISVDSAIIYKGMDIGTATPTAEELEQYPHHLVNIIEPTTRYSAADFVQDAKKLIHSIHARGHIPILVGGTMLYHHAFINGLAKMPEANPAFREQLANKANEIGWEKLHQELKSIDPIAAANIHVNDAVRITRALEVFHQTGQPISDLQNSTDVQHDYPLYIVKILPKDRASLHANIAKRLQMMFMQGFVAEVKALLNNPQIDLDSPAMRSVGYKQVADYLNGEYDYDSMQDKALFATRQFAKRQLTWLRRYFADVFTLQHGATEDFVKEFKKNFPNLQ